MTTGTATRITGIFFVLGFFVVAGHLWSEGASGTDLRTIHSALAAAGLPSVTRAKIQARIDADPVRFRRLLSVALADRKADPLLFHPVDKMKALPEDYAPIDLVSLEGTDLSVSRAGHRLRMAAFLALKSMNTAARAEGVTLLISSSYRSAAYQAEVWDRVVKAEGEAEAAASTARPGHSQHQLGTTIDFGSITDAFAQTKASRWLVANARRYGFSLSFPEGMSATTGYKWESWHYRYIGVPAAAMEGEYFSGIQRDLLLFLEKI
jgi:D-alanyl-D-alanine carboxypeptidase